MAPAIASSMGRLAPPLFTDVGRDDAPERPVGPAGRQIIDERFHRSP
jgi:hypothetical protein